MKRLVLIIFLTALTAIGCPSRPDGSERRIAASGVNLRPSKTSQEDSYSILLSVHRDPDGHVQNANYYRKVLTEKVGWRGLFVIHKAGHSEVFWGRYRSMEGAQANLKTAKAYRTDNGIPLFAKAIVVMLPGADIGPAEWNLKNAKAPYSLLVAVFKDDPERKYFGRRREAVHSCRGLRQRGYEAYFHHDNAVSHVTIGAFAAKSVRIKRTRTGKKLEILDPRIKKLQTEFPELLVNGNTVSDILRDPRTGKEVRIPKKTYLIRIPRSEAKDVR